MHIYEVDIQEYTPGEVICQPLLSINNMGKNNFVFIPKPAKNPRSVLYGLLKSQWDTVKIQSELYAKNHEFYA